MDKMDFIQGVTRTRVLENRLLSRSKIERMIEAKDIEEVFRALNETEYSNVASGISRGEDYENILSNELIRIYDQMRDISNHPVIVDLMAIKYDYHNLKVMYKEKVLQKDLSDLYIPIGTMEFDKVKSSFSEGNLKNVDEDFREAIEAVQKDFEETSDPQRIDLIFDKYYFRSLKKMADETDVELFIEYVKDMIDFTNIKTAIRLKKQQKDLSFFEDIIIPGGNIDKDTIAYTLNDTTETMVQKFKNSRISKWLLKGLEAYKETGRLSELEKNMDNYLMELNKPSKYITFGPEPIFSYLVAKEAEIKTLRIIMVSKLNNLSPESIRERVRELYV